jgi:hypothetical protein
MRTCKLEINQRLIEKDKDFAQAEICVITSNKFIKKNCVAKHCLFCEQTFNTLKEKPYVFCSVKCADEYHKIFISKGRV